MPVALSRQELRALDERAAREYGLATIVLMETAGRGAAELLLAQAGATPAGLGHVAVCCGKGNNGGDGFVLARQLAAHGVPATVLLFASPDELTPDAHTNWRILERSDFPRVIVAASPASPTGSTGERLIDANDLAAIDAELKATDWLVDGLLGTGVRGPATGLMATAIERMNAAERPILALDLPSGFDADAGPIHRPVIRAKLTATFAAAKLGFSHPESAEWTGPVHVINLGLPTSLLPTVGSC
jgi:NAD(P)H-hydrate epimerase